MIRSVAQNLNVLQLFTCMTIGGTGIVTDHLSKT